MFLGIDYECSIDDHSSTSDVQSNNESIKVIYKLVDKNTNTQFITFILVDLHQYRRFLFIFQHNIKL